MAILLQGFVNIVPELADFFHDLDPIRGKPLGWLNSLLTLISCFLEDIFPEKNNPIQIFV
jgi:hypothetical protein